MPRSMLFATKRSNVDGQLVRLSQQLLLAARTKVDTDALVNVVKNINPSELRKELETDNSKKAFWINIYNSFTQIILAQDPAKYHNKGLFFSSKLIKIGGRDLSLDDIEHGILRHSKLKWSLGYANKLFPSSFEKQMRVNKVDCRIHFALNCGAKSCPAIAFYTVDQLDIQLEIATDIYLKSETEYSSKAGKVFVPAILGWFRGDFGGKHNMIKLLKEREIIPVNSDPAIKFKKYNWNILLENYKTE